MHIRPSLELEPPEQRSEHQDTVFLEANMALMASKRLQKELTKLHASVPPGITLVSAPDLKEWHMDINVPENPLYDPAEQYRMRIQFSNHYPIEAPEVVFLILKDPPRRIPIHPHIYSNGIICLDLLAPQGWSPVHNVESICISIQSMLAGNTKDESKLRKTVYRGMDPQLTSKLGPPGDEQFVKSNRSRPREINWHFHDNTV